MTSNDNDINATTDPTAVPRPAPARAVARPSSGTYLRPERRHSTGLVIGTGLAGLFIGAVGTIAAIAFAWIVNGPPGPQFPPGSPPMLAPPFGQAPLPPPMLGPPPGGFGFGPPPGFWPPPPPPGAAFGPGQPPGPATLTPPSPAPHA